MLGAPGATAQGGPSWEGSPNGLVPRRIVRMLRAKDETWKKPSESETWWGGGGGRKGPSLQLRLQGWVALVSKHQVPSLPSENEVRTRGFWGAVPSALSQEGSRLWGWEGLQLQTEPLKR